MAERMRHKNSARLPTLALLVAAGGPFANAVAADETQVAATSDTKLEEVVITAEKRASTVQKTPVSITAITGKDLQALGLATAQSVVQAVPDIAVASAGPGQAKYEIRGLSSDGGEAATVGFYLEDRKSVV